MRDGFKTYQLIYNCSLSLVLFSLGNSKFNSISILLFSVLTIVGIFRKYLQFQPKKLLYVLSFIYVCYVVSFFFSDNQQLAGKYLEYKFSLLVFPALFSFSAPNLFVPRIIFSGLLGGITLFGLLGFFDAYNCYQESADTVCFFSSTLSTHVHPSYMAVFVTFGIAVLLIGYFQKWFITNKWVVFALVFTLLIYTIFLLSLAGILFLILAMIVALFVWMFKLFNYKGIVISVVIGGLLGVLLIKTTPIRIKSEFDGAFSIFSEAIQQSPNEYIESRNYPLSGSETRLMMWMMSWQLIKEYPFGVGSGDLDAVFEKRFKQLNQPEFAIQHYNPHNQFFQLAIEVGVPVLLIFLLFLMLLFRKVLKERNFLLLFLLFNLLFNCLFESMLQRQYGIVFYVLLICLLYDNTLNPKKANV